MNLNADASLFRAVQQINETTYTVCVAAPPHIVSDGLWGKSEGRAIMKSSLTIFELQVLIIFAITQICNFFFKFLDFPVLISQMMAGIILGPSIYQGTLDEYKQLLFPYGSQDSLATVTSIGYALFIFITAVQMDMSMITRTGHKVWTITLAGLVVPAIVGVSAAVYLYPHLREHLGRQLLELPVVVISHTVSSFAVSASLLNELKITNSELGRLALSSVLVTDMLTITSGGLISAINYKDLRKSSVYMTLFIAMFVLVPLICRPTMFWIIKRTPEGRPVSDSYIYIIIAMAFALGCAAVEIGQEFTLGAFVLGLAVPEGPPLGSALVKKLHFFGNCFFLPIFVTCSVMKADISLVNASSLTVALFVFLTHFIKMIASVVAAVLCKIPFRDACVLALILNCKGVVDLGLYIGLYDAKIITSKTYAEMLISTMIIACTVKWSVKFLYDPSRKYAGYQKRNIMNLKQNSELRIVACIHKKYHIPAITDVLNICCPTAEHPIVVDALHLIELVGRTSPVFISHRHQKAVSGSERSYSYSDDVILAFDHYEHDNRGTTTTHIYTALSPPTMMHEDVCQLALDKVASFVILPFHKRWSSDGAIESDDKNIRTLNCRLLEIAPCSVGILVSRSSFQNDTYIRLAMVYVGGLDDREALCLAKRAMGDPRINLVVYHLLLNEYIQDMQDLLDNEVLEDVKSPPPGVENVRYEKVIANDGSETSAILRDIVYEHDLFLVGRRYGMDSPQTEGLSDWSEFPELGPIGDLLASPDFESRASILVVQQQGSKTKSRIF